MNIPALFIGLGAAVLLLLAGYLAGLRRGSKERTRLRGGAEQQAAILQRWKSALDDDGTLKSTIEQVLAPLVERERLSIEQVLAPLVERECQSLDMARVGSAGERRDLSPLLEQVASVGNFGSVLLSNEDGLVVASAGTAPDFDAMAAATARLTGVADQFAARRGGALAILIRDAADSTTLCRLFTTHGQRMALTATSNDTRLVTVALDPALAKIDTALAAPVQVEG
jgi:predicted regulator of Ras-like GTPase activity (Roadblock/LC7/MglB family)